MCDSFPVIFNSCRFDVTNYSNNFSLTVDKYERETDILCQAKVDEKDSAACLHENRCTSFPRDPRKENVKREEGDAFEDTKGNHKGQTTAYYGDYHGERSLVSSHDKGWIG